MKAPPSRGEPLFLLIPSYKVEGGRFSIWGFFLTAVGRGLRLPSPSSFPVEPPPPLMTIFLSSPHSSLNWPAPHHPLVFFIFSSQLPQLDRQRSPLCRTFPTFSAPSPLPPHPKTSPFVSLPSLKIFPLHSCHPLPSAPPASAPLFFPSIDRPTQPNSPHTHLPSPLIFFFSSAAGNKPTAASFLLHRD